MVIIWRQVNSGLDAWQIRSSQRMGRPFICLINSEPLSIFNHQRGNEINNLMMPTTLFHSHTHTHSHTYAYKHKTMLKSKCPFIVALIMSTGRDNFLDLWSTCYLRYFGKQRAFLFDLEVPFSPFPFCQLRCVPVKSHRAAWVHTAPQSSVAVISQPPVPCSSDLNLQFGAWASRCTPPCGSAPPPLSLTRIASILPLVKLTSSLNYANKAIVICICTACRHVEWRGWGWVRGCWGWCQLESQSTKEEHPQTRHTCTNRNTYLWALNV